MRACVYACMYCMQAVDAERREAVIGPGVSGAALAAALAPHGLHYTLPHISHVGVSGFIVGK